jgi:hypothetical protein
MRARSIIGSVLLALFIFTVIMWGIGELTKDEHGCMSGFVYVEQLGVCLRGYIHKEP